MRKKNLLLILLIMACVVTFLGYRALAELRSDDKAPEIRLDAIIPEISVEDPKSALLQGITAKDNVDGDVTSSLVVEHMELLDGEGNLMVHYAAFDQAGNVAKTQREAKFTDYRSPRFTLGAPLVYRKGVSFDVLGNVGATDVIDGEIQHRVRATMLSNESIAESGIHDVEFQVTNSLGDTVTAVLPVQVSDEEQDAYLRLKTYLVYLPQNTSFNPKDYLDGLVYLDEQIELNYGLPQSCSLKTEGNVQTNTPGVYPVEFWVTHTIENELNPQRNVEYTGYSKLIVIVEG